MDPRFKTNLLEHVKAIGAWATRRAAESRIDAVDCSLTLRLDGRTLRLQPQFAGRRGGPNFVYFDVPDAHAMAFVGWLPYGPQAWDVSLSKRRFKTVAAEAGLPVPRGWSEPGLIDAPFLVKRERGAFGIGMHGPYPPERAATLNLAEGEFAEAFVWGRIARAWYWSGRLTVLEVFDMPGVAGDGCSTYEALLRRQGAELPADFASIAALQGVAPGDVPAAGRRIVCDYRYVSPFNPTVYANANRLPREAGSALVERFREAGRRFWPCVPGPAGYRAAFVLDAIVDADDRPCFLEVNSNPQGHPDAYAQMLDDLFGVEPR